MIAMVLDRLMFYVFLLIYTVGTAIFAIKVSQFVLLYDYLRDRGRSLDTSQVLMLLL